MFNKKNRMWFARNLTPAFMLVLLALTGCSSDDGFSLTVNVDGTDYAFTSCGQYPVSYNGYETEAGCIYEGADSGMRITFYKAFDANGGELKVELTDIPDLTLLDSPYGIFYSCSTLNPALPCGTAAEPTYNAATGTISLSSVELPNSGNTTLEYSGVFVAGTASHTVTTSANIDSFPVYQ